MDLHLDILLNLPNVTVFSCYQKEGLTILQLDLLNDKVSCNYCGKSPDDFHQIRQQPNLIQGLTSFDWWIKSGA